MRKQGSQAKRLGETQRKSPRLNKVVHGKSQPFSTRRKLVTDVPVGRAARSMKFTDTEKDTSVPSTGRRGSLRNQHTRKAAERASEDIAVELILEDETDEDSRNFAFDAKTDDYETGTADGESAEKDDDGKPNEGYLAPKRGRKPKRKRGQKKTGKDKLEEFHDYETNGSTENNAAVIKTSVADNEMDSDGDDKSTASSYTPPPSKKSKLKTGILEKLQDSSGFVDRVEISLKPEDLVPMRRTPRMAGLNALAKVNAVLDSYSAPVAKNANETKKSREKKLIPLANSRVDRRERKSLSGLSILENIDLPVKGGSTSRRRCSSLSSHMDFQSIKKANSRQEYWEEFKIEPQNINEENKFLINKLKLSQGIRHSQVDARPISDNHVSSTSSWFADDGSGVKKIDKAVQTVVNHKAVQTDSYLLQGYRDFGNRQRTCKCGKSKITNFNGSDKTYSRKIYTRIPPRISSSAVNLPLQSSLFTKTDLHTIAIPFTKRHMLSHTELKDYESIAPENLDVNRNKRMASLNAMAMMNAMVVLDQPYTSLIQNNCFYPNLRETLHEKQTAPPLKIPKINYAATSTSNFSSSYRVKGPVPLNYKALQLKNFSSTVEKLVGRSVPSSPKMVNGWMFDGEPIEKPFEYDDRIVLRRYYTSMKRNNEVINVRDSVLLKSGTKKKDIPFVARVAAIWEEDDGDSVSDMTISVFWYYRPEQTEKGRLGNFHGEMEVLASRHRDDNSVACIVDKCYVLSYPQYCRFRARSKLHRESRKTPLSPVPPAESTRPGSMPPPNTDPSLVFFCRQVYDFRTGRVLKNPLY